MRLIDSSITHHQYEIVLAHLYLAGPSNEYHTGYTLYDIDHKYWYSTTSIQILITMLGAVDYITGALRAEISSGFNYLDRNGLVDRYAPPQKGKKGYFRLNDKGLMYLKTKYNTLGTMELIDPNPLIRTLAQQLRKEEANESKDLSVDDSESK